MTRDVLEKGEWLEYFRVKHKTTNTTGLWQIRHMNPYKQFDIFIDCICLYYTKIYTCLDQHIFTIHTNIQILVWIVKLYWSKQVLL